MDSISILLKDLKDCPRFSREEEASLAERMHAGDIEARKLLAKSCFPWAIKKGVLFHRRYPSVSQDEMISEAFLGLMESLDPFQPSMGRLTTYSAIHIAKRCILASRRLVPGIVIKVPIGKLWKDIGDLEFTKRPALSLDYLPTEEKKFLYFLGKDDDLQENLHKSDQLGRLRYGISLLEGRDQRVLVARFLEGKTLQVIGREMGLTKERVRQIAERGLIRLKEKIVQNKQVPPSFQVSSEEIIREEKKAVDGDMPLDNKSMDLGDLSVERMLEYFLDHATLLEIDRVMQKVREDFRAKEIVYQRKLLVLSAIRKALDSSCDVIQGDGTRRKVVAEVEKFLRIQGKARVSEIAVGINIANASVSSALCRGMGLGKFEKISGGWWGLINGNGSVCPEDSQGEDSSKQSNNSRRHKSNSRVA